MDDRWREIERVYHVARERDKSERPDFLAEACAGDEDLRREVESLLVQADQHRSFLESPAFEVAAEDLAKGRRVLDPSKSALEFGTMVSHYRVTAKLGAGGMGEVYRARDTKLGRDVALKILPEAMARDAQRMARFEREARTLALLNHPNIAAIHDLEESNGVHALVMELVEGETLAERIARVRLVPAYGRPQEPALSAAKGSPLQESLTITKQIAEALEYAHERGIIHRDLKPANVKITPEGTVKLLDFGLGKGIGPGFSPAHPDAGLEAGAADSPTPSTTATQAGTILGTPAYMSPEQARGQPVDRRTDIWAFGCVFYEMLTGRKAFEGEMLSDVLAAVLTKEPDWNALPASTPEPIQKLLRHCLVKDAKQRLRDIGDARLAIEETLTDATTTDLPGPIPAGTAPQGVRAVQGPTWRRRWSIAVSAAVLLLLIGGATAYRFLGPGRTAPAPPMRIVPFTSYPGHQVQPSFSPDGNQIAFAWDGEKEDNADIYVKMIGAEKPLRLTTDPAPDMLPVWSPDGRYIAFLRQGAREDGIYIVPALGGPERKLVTPNLGATSWLESFDWSPDGKYMAYVDRPAGQQAATLFLLAIDNPDDKRPLTTSADGQWADLWPQFSPDGKTVAFIRRYGQGDAEDIHLVRVAGGRTKRLTFDNVRISSRLAWTPDGAYIIFSSQRLGGQGRLWKVAASGGDPEPLPVGQGNAFNPSLSRDGHRLAYTLASRNVNIWQYQVRRTTDGSAPPTRLIASAGDNQGPQFSPDGKKIAFSSDRSGAYEIWVCDSDGSNSRQLTSFNGFAGTPRWSPDGREIVFDASPEGHLAIYVVSVDGGRPRCLTTDSSNESVASWSKDGKWIYFASDKSGTLQIWKRPAQGGPAVQVTKKGGDGPFESPDGKYLYYAKGMDVPGLWKVPVEGGEETPVLAPLGAGLWGFWGLAAGGVYFYDASTRAIESFDFATRKLTQVAVPEKPPSRWGPGFTVSPDGRSILFAQVDETSSRIMLVENFRW